MTREQKIVEAHTVLDTARNRRLQAEAMQKAARKVVSDADKEFWAASEAESEALRALLRI